MTKTLKDEVALLEKVFTGRPFDKALFHRRGKAALKLLAADMDLSLFEVRSNVGGPAVRGEVVLHTPFFYVMLCGDLYGRRHDVVLYRSCNGMKDYTGGRNCYTTIASLGNPEFHALLRKLQERVAA